MKTMLMDYQSLTVEILVSTFGLMLVAVVKELLIDRIVLVLLMLHTLPSFVGNNYYCESASWYKSDTDAYYDTYFFQ